MLNFTAGAAGLMSALRTAVVKRIITAHRFIELAKLDALAAEISRAAEMIYLEDVRKKLSIFDKAVAGIGQFVPRLVASRPANESPAVILFTSGSEGEPKGVALSHANLLVNVKQVCQHVAFFPSDVLFSPLPTFHCFGLVGGVLCPCYWALRLCFILRLCGHMRSCGASRKQLPRSCFQRTHSCRSTHVPQNKAT